AGPLKGGGFTLTEDETYIGRSGDNAGRIYDPADPANLAVSRKHCLIRKAGGGIFIQDLKSRNKKLVNGDPVTERRLEHGDHIGIADFRLIFLLGDNEAPSLLTTIQLDDGSLAALNLFKLPREDSYNMVGESAAMKKVYQSIARVAGTD